MNKKLSALIGIVIGLPAFFSDRFAGMIFSFWSLVGIDDVNIFGYLILVVITYLPIIVVVSLFLKNLRGMRISDSLYTQILGIIIAYGVYMIFAIFSLRNLVGGL